MNRDQIQDLLQLFALAGVIASLVFVGYEIKLSRQIALAEIAQQRANADIVIIDRTIIKEELVPAIRVSRESPESLTDRQRRMVISAMEAELIQLENVHYQYRLGLIDEEQMVAQRFLIWRLLRTPLERATWEDMASGTGWSQSFFDEVESVFSEFE